MMSRKLTYLLCCSIIIGCAGSRTDSHDLSVWVDPFIGTGGHGHTFPGAAYPFGMIQLSPDTRPLTRDWDGCSGYHISDTLIYGFSHTHLSGTGCDDYCDILLSPLADDSEASVENHTSTFSHESEYAEPGYYRVYLDKPRAKVELYAGRRAAMHRYTFSEGDDAVVLLDLNYRDILKDAFIHQSGECAVSGLRRSTNWSMEQSVYFYIEFDKPFANIRYDDKLAVMTFSGNELTVRVGISSVSEENARLNMLSEDCGWDVEKMKAAARKEWNSYLSKIDITPDCKANTPKGRKDLTVFYTSLYHTAIHPSLYSDVNGEYRGMDREIHTAEGFDRYTVFSIWDTFRAQHPLLLMIEPDRVVDFLKTFISIYEEMGRLPIWEISAYDTDCMVGFNSASVIADAFAAGIVPEEIKEKLLEALVVSSECPEHGLDSFNKYGYVRGEDENETVSRTLEYAYDCWCVSTVAAALGRTDLEEKYLYRSKFWMNLFDSDCGFMRPRFNGQWVADFSPLKVSSFFTEANSAQYSFFVPHDLGNLMEAMGGEKEFEKKLDWLFATDEQVCGEYHPDISGMVGQYAHGNEPSHHIAYLYSNLGKPRKAWRIVGGILENLYSTGPEGICGNEDCGQMSAWYVMSSLGIYNSCPGDCVKTSIKPEFPRATVWSPDGGRIPVSSIGTSAPRVHRVDCDGFVASPVFEVEKEIFDDSTLVSIGNIPEGCIAVCNGVTYEGPFEVSESCELTCYAIDRDGHKSMPNCIILQKRSNDRKVSTADNDANGNLLCDGCHSFVNWRCGGWYDCASKALDAVIDLGSEREIRMISARFAQDLRQTIWTPREVSFELAGQSGEFVAVGTVPTKTGEQDLTPLTETFSVNVPRGQYRYIHVLAKNIAVAPDWHPMSGQAARILCDEIITN